jgi:hypothetical protein
MLFGPGLKNVGQILAQSEPPTKIESPSPTGTAETDANGNPLVENKISEAPTKDAGGLLSGYEFQLTLIVSLVAFFTLILEFLLLRKINSIRAEDILRVFGVTLIILGTLFFVTVGYSANQVAPAIGLFGTVAGYLLGRSIRNNEPPTNDKPQKD